jgi:hypothetical protein
VLKNQKINAQIQLQLNELGVKFDSTLTKAIALNLPSTLVKENSNIKKS